VDLFMILRHIIHMQMLTGPVDSAGSQLWGADANGDTLINILDLMKCINKSVGRLDPKLARPFVTMSVPSEVEVMGGRSLAVPVGLSNEEALAGVLYRLRYDRSVVEIARPELTERSAGMTLDWSVVGDQTWVLLSSLEGKAIQGGSGAVLEIPFRMNEDVAGTQVLFEETVLFLADERIVFADPATLLVKGLALVPTEYALEQNYPNPFNPNTAVNYQIPMTKSQVHTTLKIYNILGQEVATLVDEVKEPGYYTVTWDAPEMASGVYFYCLTAGEFTTTRNMVLMK